MSATCSKIVPTISTCSCKKLMDLHGSTIHNIIKRLRKSIEISACEGQGPKLSLSSVPITFNLSGSAALKTHFRKLLFVAVSTNAS